MMHSEQQPELQQHHPTQQHQTQQYQPMQQQQDAVLSTIHPLQSQPYQQQRCEWTIDQPHWTLNMQQQHHNQIYSKQRQFEPQYQQQQQQHSLMVDIKQQQQQQQHDIYSSLTSSIVKSASTPLRVELDAIEQRVKILQQLQQAIRQRHENMEQQKQQQQQFYAISQSSHPEECNQRCFMPSLSSSVPTSPLVLPIAPVNFMKQSLSCPSTSSHQQPGSHSSSATTSKVTTPVLAPVHVMKTQGTKRRHEAEDEFEPCSPNSISLGSDTTENEEPMMEQAPSASTVASKRAKLSHLTALSNGSSVGDNGFIPVDSPQGLSGVLSHLTPAGGWFPVSGADMRLMVRRVPSPDVKRSVQTKQLRLSITLFTTSGELLSVPYLLMDLCDKKGISNKPGSKQYSYAAYSISAQNGNGNVQSASALVDSVGRQYEIIVLMMCEPTKSTAAGGKRVFSSSSASLTCLPNNIRSRHPASDPSNRMNCTLLYQTEPKFVAYRVRYFMRELDAQGNGVLAHVSNARTPMIHQRQLDLVEWGHNQKPTTVAHAGFMPILEEWSNGGSISSTSGFKAISKAAAKSTRTSVHPIRSNLTRPAAIRGSIWAQ